MFIYITSTAVVIILALILVPKYVNLPCYPSRSTLDAVDARCNAVSTDVMMGLRTEEGNALILRARSEINYMVTEFDRNGKCKRKLKRIATIKIVHNIQRRRDYLIDPKMKDKASYIARNIDMLSKVDTDKPLVNY